MLQYVGLALGAFSVLGSIFGGRKRRKAEKYRLNLENHQRISRALSQRNLYMSRAEEIRRSAIEAKRASIRKGADLDRQQLGFIGQLRGAKEDITRAGITSQYVDEGGGSRTAGRNAKLKVLASIQNTEQKITESFRKKYAAKKEIKEDLRGQLSSLHASRGYKPAKPFLLDPKKSSALSGFFSLTSSFMPLASNVMDMHYQNKRLKLLAQK